MFKKFILPILILIAALLAGFFLTNAWKKNSSVSQKNAQAETAEPSTISVAEKTEPEKITPAANQSEQPAEPVATPTQSIILQAVPFVVQAPFANWSDPNFQNACEEASMVMAMGWVNNEKTISPAEAQKRILAIIGFENKTLGYSADTNAFDMEKIFQQYFKHKNVVAQENVTLADLKAQLGAGNLVLVSVFGQALKNPNFTAPGPIAHMLVLIGYDPTTQEFITNDPGTKHGAGYRYDENLLFGAIWEYPSGKTIPPVPTPSKMKKAMLSVSK